MKLLIFYGIMRPRSDIPKWRLHRSRRGRETDAIAESSRDMLPIIPGRNFWSSRRRMPILMLAHVLRWRTAMPSGADANGLKRLDKQVRVSLPGEE
jgi:hypothetical protein